MRHAALLALALTACRVESVTFIATDSTVELVEVGAFPGGTVTNELDMLFVVDDSPGSGALNIEVTRAFQSFLNNFYLPNGQVPSLHLGLTTGDFGLTGLSDSSPGPSTVAGCSGFGKGGAMTVNGTAGISGNFIVDTQNMDGTRTKNYNTSLHTMFTAMMGVGEQGCQFQQPLHAAKRALNNNPANAGFKRANAYLAVIFISTQDDCSPNASTFFSPSDSLGPLTPFRCTRFGVTCDYGGSTPEAMNQPGTKLGCRIGNSGQLLSITDVGNFFARPEPHKLILRSIMGPASDVIIEQGGQGSQLRRACGNTNAAMPAVRLHEITRAVAKRPVLSACTTPLDDEMAALATHITSAMGKQCLEREIPTDTECIVEVDGVARPKCGTTSGDCYTIAPTGGGCSKGYVTMSPLPPAGSWTTVRCRI